MINRRRHMRLIKGEPCGESDTKIKVAFASIGLKEVNQHFGLAKGFAIYSISADDFEVLEAAGFDSQKTYEAGHSEDKLSDKIELIQDCVAVYSNAVGPRAVSRLLEKDIHPIKVDEGTPITDLVEELQKQLQSDELPGWMKRVITNKIRHDDKENSDRLANMFEQDWSEIESLGN